MDFKLKLDWDDFLANYWQKRPVVIRGAFEHFNDPITPDELAGLAMENEVDSRLVSQPNGHWQAAHGPFERFDHLGEKGWSLLVQSVDHWHVPSANLVKPFMKMPQWRFDDLMISFSMPEGGVGPHIDNYDVFIIQGLGRRCWRVGEALPLKQYCPHPALLHVEPFDPIIDEILEPGDILYIPPGFPHDGYTLETALSYSIGFRAPNTRDLISGFADFVLEEDLGGTHYSDPELVLPADPAMVQPHELEKLQAMMIDLIRQPETFAKWFGRFTSTPRHELDIASPEPLYEAEEIYELLHDGETLTRLQGLKLIKVADHYYVNGESIISSHSRGLDKLTAHLKINKTLLGEDLENSGFIALLTELINSGYWYFDN